MANLTPNEYFQAQFSDPKWVLIKAVRVDSPNTNWKKTVQPIVWLVKKDKKHAEFVSLWTNSYEADGTTYKKNPAPQQGYFQFNFTFEFSKSKDEMETFIADSVMQNEMIIKALSKEAGITDGPWSITQDPWDPNVVPKRLRPDTEPVVVENKSVTTTEPTVATSSVGASASNVDDSNVGASASNVGATASILGEFTFNVEQDNTFIGVNNQFGTLYTIGIGEIKEEPIDKPEEGELLPEEGLDEEYSEDIFMGDEELKQTFDAYITQISENQNITPAEKVEIAKEIVAYKPAKPSKTPPADITKAMKDYGIKTALEKAHFLAQCAHESGEFAWKREFASGKAYEGRKDLGNTQTGDGVKYKGRGYIQITGRANYTAYNKYLKAKGINDDVVTNPTLLEGKFAADCSVWYWVVLGPPNNKNFTKKANEGATEAIVTKISRWVNGGDNGLADRKTKFNFYWSILDKNPNSYS